MLSTNQRYKIECNSQLKDISEIGGGRCCLQIKDTKLNAIHNVSIERNNNTEDVVYKSKIQNWMQFTTAVIRDLKSTTMLSTNQRYKIECNSQR